MRIRGRLLLRCWVGNDHVDLVFVGAFLEFVDCWSDLIAWVEETLLVNDEGCGAW